MKNLKTIATLLFSLCLVFVANAQKDKSKRKSPPAQVTANVNGADVTIDYSKPSKRSRDIFGSLVPYGKVWRTGANESTWMEISKDVKVEGEVLPAGKYGLFTIPGEDKWIIIFNSNSSGWGAYEYKESEDVLRVEVESATADFSEQFIVKIADNGAVSMVWDTTLVSFSIN